MTGRLQLCWSCSDNDKEETFYLADRLFPLLILSGIL